MEHDETVRGATYSVPGTLSRAASGGPAENGAPRGPDSDSVAKNTLYNLTGQILPLIVAVFAVPPLIAGLGDAGFGILAIAWMFVGYFSLFDLGLSRALTQLVARMLGSGDEEGVEGLVWTGLLLSTAVGVVGAVIMAVAAPYVALDLLEMPGELRGDTLRAFYAIAVAVPIIVSTANLRGLLEAVHRFDIINIIRIPLGASTFAGPLLVLPFSNSLFAMVVVLIAARVLAWLAYLVACVRVLPWLRSGIRFERRLVRRLLQFGGWMTVSNAVSPLMVYLDRFLIGIVLTASAVAYYATPWEVVTKLLLIPTAFSAVLFPTFSYFSERRPQRAGRMFYSGIKFMLLAMLPFVILAVALARPGLSLWLGEAFAAESYRPLQILAVGVLLNGLAAVPFAFIQGLGRPDLTAKLHLLELPLYVALLWVLLASYGIVGAAVAWMIRVGLDLVLLYAIGRDLFPAEGGWERKLVGGFIAAVASLGGLLLIDNPALLAGAAGVVVLVFGLLAWWHFIDGEERGFLVDRISRYLRWV